MTRWNETEKEINPNLVAPLTQNKHGSHYIWYLVLNVLSMYLTCTLVLASALIHPNRNANHLFELVSYTFLANKLKILYKTLYKRLIEKKWVKHAPGYFLTFCFPFTYIKTSSSKPRPINLWSKYVLLRKHMQVHVLKTIKNTLQFLLIGGGRIKMKIRKEKMKQFISTIHK